jgi:ABC-type multidrug transport system fused ATPase/permease subunit
LGEKVLLNVRTDIYDSFINKDTEFYDINKSGELMSRISSDCATL